MNKEWQDPTGADVWERSFYLTEDVNRGLMKKQQEEKDHQWDEKEGEETKYKGGICSFTQQVIKYGEPLCSKIKTSIAWFIYFIKLFTWGNVPLKSVNTRRKLSTNRNIWHWITSWLVNMYVRQQILYAHDY